MCPIEPKVGTFLGAKNDEKICYYGNAFTGSWNATSPISGAYTVSGSGAKPKPGDTVKVHYEGTLINGSVFDSSYYSSPQSGLRFKWIGTDSPQCDDYFQSRIFLYCEIGNRIHEY